jgi:hypothetical protein
MITSGSIVPTYGRTSSVSLPIAVRNCASNSVWLL